MGYVVRAGTLAFYPLGRGLKADPGWIRE